MTGLVSVIVPVYNVEKTLVRCVESILNQTYKSLDIILVDDGSTDQSPEICDDLARKHSIIRTFHKENEGLGPTRNYGIKKAIGEYIYHCDSDDWLDNNLIEKCVHAIRDSDAVLFGYTIYTEKGNELIKYEKVFAEAEFLVGKERIRGFFTRQFGNYFLVESVCNKLWRKSFIIDNALFVPDFRRSQDVAYSFFVFDRLSKLVVLGDCMYNYVIRPGNLNKGRSFQETIDTRYRIYKISLEFYEKWGVLSNDERIKLTNRAAEVFVNFTTHAIAVKYKREWRDIVRFIFDNDDYSSVLSSYRGASRFIKSFRFSYKIRSSVLLKAISEIHHIISKFGKNI